MASPLPFTIRVPDETLTDLRMRLERVRWPDERSGRAWEHGTDLSYMNELVSYWRGQYDWRAHEARLNRRKQFVVGLEGGAKSAPPCPRNGGAKAAQEGAIPRKGGALAIAPDPLVNPSIDPSSTGQQFFSHNNKDLTPEQRAANIHRLAQMTSELARKKHMDTAEARRPGR